MAQLGLMGIGEKLPINRLGKETKGLTQKINYNELEAVKDNRNLKNPCQQEAIPTEDLLELAITHLKKINIGDLTNNYTTEAIKHLEEAKNLLIERKIDREKRGVFGTNQT